MWFGVFHIVRVRGMWKKLKNFQQKFLISFNKISFERGTWNGHFTMKKSMLVSLCDKTLFGWMKCPIARKHWISFSDFSVKTRNYVKEPKAIKFNFKVYDLLVIFFGYVNFFLFGTVKKSLISLLNKVYDPSD